MASIAKRADGQWRARYRDAAGREHARHFRRKVDAQRWLDGVTAAVETGTYVDPRAGRVTVGEWADRWLHSQAQLKPTTLARYRGILHGHLVPKWADRQLATVSHAEIQSWVAGQVSAGLAPATVRKHFRVLSLVLDLAVRDGRLARNPCTGINLPRAEQARRRYLTHRQVHMLAAETARPRPGTRLPHREREFMDSYRLVVLVLAYCGLRWGELAALKAGRVDTGRRRLEVVESVVEVDGVLVWGVPKGYERRSVPVPAFLLEELRRHLEGRQSDDLLFTGLRGGGVLRNRIFRRAGFDRAAAAVGLEGLVPHELRHTAASLAVSSGANVKAVQRMLGHASAALTLDTYADLFDDDLDAVADGLDDAARHVRGGLADFLRTGDGNDPDGGPSGPYL
jgi:integrase